MRAVPVDGVAGFGAFALEEAGDGAAQPRVGEPVEAPGRHGVEAAQLLVLAAGAGLEAREPVLDALLDARVVADVEVDVAERPQRAPVAPVERVEIGRASVGKGWTARRQGDGAE